jgi:hypothetical protein
MAKFSHLGANRHKGPLGGFGEALACDHLARDEASTQGERPSRLDELTPRGSVRADEIDAL